MTPRAPVRGYMAITAHGLAAAMRPSQLAAGWEPFAAGLARGICALAVPLLVLQLFDRAIPAARPDELYILAAAIVLLLGLYAALGMAARHIARQPAAAGLRQRAEAAATALFTGAFDARPAAAPAEASATAGPAALHLAGLIVLFPAMALLTGGLTLVPALFCAAAFLAAWWCSREPLEAMPDAPIARGVVDALWTVKAMGAEQLLLRRAEAEAVEQAGVARRRAGARFGGAQAAVLLDRLTLIAAITLGAILVLNGLATVGQMAAGALLSTAMVRAAFRGTECWRRNLVAAQARPRPATALKSEAVDTRPPLPLVGGRVEVRRVSWDAPADGLHPVARLLLDRVSLTIKQGEAVALTGGDPAQCGALLRVMSGHDKPGEGMVLVDGLNLAEHRADSLRRQIAYIPPVGDVLPGTLLENLTGFETARAGDALGAARLVGLDARAARLTDGYDTRLEAVGHPFPAGFRQHLAFARALANKPKVLLLDHATENLDSQDLRRISDILHRLKGRVTIVFASTQEGLRTLADREIDVGNLKPAPAGQTGDGAEGGQPDAQPDMGI